MSREMRVKKTYSNKCRPVFVYCKRESVSSTQIFNYKHKCEYKYTVFILLYLLLSIARNVGGFPSWTSKMHFRWHHGNLSTPVLWSTCNLEISTPTWKIFTEPPEHSPKGKSHCSLLMVKLLKAALLQRRYRHNLKILCAYLDLASYIYL